MDDAPRSNALACLATAAAAVAGRKRKEPPPDDSEGQADAAAAVTDSGSRSRSHAAPTLRSTMNADGHSSRETTAGRVRNVVSEADEHKAAAAAAPGPGAAASADPDDDDAALTTDGGGSSSSQAAAAALVSPQQPSSAPVPLSASAADPHPPSAAVRVADAAAPSATALIATSAAAAVTVPMLQCTIECRDVRFAVRLVPGSDTAAGDRESAACGQLLRALPRFTRLRTLQVKLCDAFTSAPLLPTTFAALSDSLLELQLRGHGSRQAALINAALAHVGRLRQLTTLAVVVGDGRVAREVDLSQLPSLPYLCKFSILVEDERRRADQLWFRFTPTQIQSLAQCRQLTYLFGGIWSPDEREFHDEGWQLPPAAQQIDEGIAALVRGLTLQTADAAVGAGASASSVAPRASTASFCRLQFLNLRGTVMSAAVWEHVSRLTELTELVPQCWRSDITPQQWARLADFKQLKMIRIASHPDDDSSSTPLRTEHFLPHLLQCTQLHSVGLVGSTLSLSAAQLDGIARLPRLIMLALRSVEVESVAPLVQAAGLERLYLFFCRRPPGVVDFRRSLPPLPELTLLTVEDRCRMTAAQAAPLNAALLACMPKLTPANFHQNLLA